MIQTLSDVIENHDNLLQKFNLVKEGTERDPLFDSSRMDGVIVLPDEVAKGFLLADYSFNSHFVPGSLPASGEIIGDFLEHEDRTYLTLNFWAMITNLKLFHLVRGIEPIYKNWHERIDELSQEAEAFIKQVRIEEAKVLSSVESANIVKKVLDKPENWRNTYVGWSYLGTPCSHFVDASLEISDKCDGLLAEKASELESKLRPYCDLPETLEGFRNQISHKGIPIIRDGMIRTNKPATSGGASIHTHGAGDDVSCVLPNANDMFIIATQAGTIGVSHFGGGNVTGEHIIFCPPRTPFFKLVQEAIDVNSELKDIWQDLKDKTDGEFLEEAVGIWLDITKEIKEQVMVEVVPDIISKRVLGFHVDLKSERRVAQLHPVVSECAIQINEEMINKHKWEILNKEVDSVVIETSDGYSVLSPIC